MKRSLFFGVSILVLAGCSLFPQKEGGERKISSVALCPLSEKYPPLFTVVENTSEKIIVEFGDMAKFFQLKNGEYEFKVMFKGSKENKEEKPVEVQRGEGSGQVYRVVQPVKKTGVYEFSVFKKESEPVWKQKVFAVAAIPDALSEEEKADLAKLYAPVVSYHDDELYFPVSLEYLTNQVEVDPILAEEPFRLTNKRVKSLFSWNDKSSLDIEFSFSDINKILPYYGHSESVLKSGLDAPMTRLKSRYGEKNVTVYYSVFENVKWKEIYINYHFFYAYDPKNGTEGNEAMAAHMFDRESMTVVLRRSSKLPLSVFYGAHLASQTMGHLDASGDALQKWDSGRVFVNWPEVPKIKGRVMPVAALGSHGVFPKKGNYAVFLNQTKILEEPAGGDRLLYPSFATDFPKTATSHSYELRDLKLNQVTSGCENPNHILAFSGSTVDVLGPANATFPPFTDREEDFMTYADPNAPLFDMSK